MKVISVAPIDIAQSLQRALSTLTRRSPEAGGAPTDIETRQRDMVGPGAVAGLCELTLETRALDELERFYTELLGLAVLSRSADRIWLACGPRARLGLWTPGAKEFGDRGGRHVHFAFSVEPGKLPSLAARARAAGGVVRGPVEHDGGDRSLYLEDPEGNVVELWDFFERGRDVQSLAA